MSAPKYQPVLVREEELDDNALGAHQDPLTSQTLTREESQPIISKEFSLSDSEDELSSDSEESPTHTGPQHRTTPAHPLQVTPGIEVVPPVATSAEEEEKPDVPTQPRLVGMGNDGVFANLAAKPERITPRNGGAPTGLDQPPPTPPTGEGDGECNPDGPLPNYDEAMQEPSPPHFDDAVGHPTSLAGVQIDDLLVEGLPVGGVLSFAWNAMVSQLFHFIGFLLTYLLHINHAGRLGSTTGLGITFLSMGLTFRKNIQEQMDNNGGNSNNDDIIGINLNANEEEYPESAVWLAYMLMILGWLIILKSVTEYVRLRRERDAILTSPEAALSH